MSIVFPGSADGPAFTGERYLPGVTGQLQFEHFHRYLYASQFVAGKAVLDIACGDGYGSFALAPLASQVIGIDIDHSAVARACEAYVTPKLRFMQGRLERIPLGDAAVDVAVCFETIEHMSDQISAVRELRRVLRPSGMLMISTPNAHSADGAWHQENPFHEKELSRTELLALLACEFRNVRVLEQRYLVGSAIGGSETTAGMCSSFESTDSVTFETIEGLGDSYFIALASNAPLPAAGFSVLDSPSEQKRLVADLQYAVARMNTLEMEKAALQKRLDLALLQLRHARARTLADAEKLAR